MFRWRNTRPADRPGEGGEAPEGEMLALIYLRPVRVSRAPGLVLSVVLAVFWATQARSAAGDLDPTFGQGIVTTSFGGQAEVAQAMAIQSDGKLVLVGGTQLGLNPGIPDHFAVARYNVDGTLDPGFGTGGKATTAVFGFYENAAAVVVQPDGKLVVAGHASTAVNLGGDDFAVVRYDPNGTLDPSFGTGGKVTTDFNQLADHALALVRQPDGKLVAGGLVQFGSSFLFGLARYNLDGSLDGSFGTGGKVTTSFNNLERVHTLLLQPDGKVVAVGATVGSQTLALARYNPNGTLDADFGSGGKVTAPGSLSLSGPLATQDGGVAAVLQADGKIVTASTGTLGDSDAFEITRFNPNGSLDATFGSGGKIFTAAGRANAIAIQPDDKLVVVGTALLRVIPQFALARYNPDGSLDTTFGSGGTLTTGMGTAGTLTDGVGTSANAVAVQGDGRIVAAGGEAHFALTRFLPDGTLDETLAGAFEGGGRVLTDFSGGTGPADAVILQPDGKIVAAGVTIGPGAPNGDFALARYDLDGRLDAGFGAGGKVTTDFGKIDQAYALARQPDGKLVALGVTGYVYIAAVELLGDFALARYNADGTLDPTFGTGGKVTTDFGGAGRPRALALQADGKLVAAGSTPAPDGSDFALVRYLSDGTLDPTFGSGGRATTDFSGVEDDATGVALEPDGKIVVVGSKGPVGLEPPAVNAARDFALARYNPDGSLDPTFGTGGKVTTDFAGNDDRANAVLVVPGHKLLAIGGALDANGEKESFAVARYNADGSLDATFGTGGKVTTSFAGGPDEARAGVLLPDGSVVVAGAAAHAASSVGHSRLDFGMVRYTTAGILDAGFGTCSKVTTDFFGGDDTGRAIVVQPDGRLVVVGDAFGPSGAFAIGRYEGGANMPPICPESCGNCIDDNGDGRIDFEDPACCTTTARMRIRRVRFVATSGLATEGRLVLRSLLGRRGFAGVNPTTQDVTIQLRSAGAERLCMTVPRQEWAAAGRNRPRFSFSDRTLGEGFVGLKGSGAATFESKSGPPFDITGYAPGKLEVTMQIGGRCSAGTVKLRRLGKKGFVFP